MLNSIFVLSNFIEKDPGAIVGTISKILGFILNFVFNIIYSFTVNNSLGITIILFTIIIRFIMLPLAYKQQKSMYIMQKLQPEIKKIQEKYKNKTKDPEATKKMQIEMSNLYSKHKYNPFGGCLPLLVQLPLFIALYFIMRNSYLFISEISNIYTELAQNILNTDGYIDAIKPIAQSLTPSSLDGRFDITVLADLKKYLNKFSVQDWIQLKDALPSLNIDPLLDIKNNIEYFVGINLTETVGFRFPKVLIAIISGFTTFLSSWIISRKSKSDDPNVKMQQKIMNLIMPIMIGGFTVNIPCGVGIYWIAGNIVQIFQQLILGKYCENKFENMEV